MSMVVSQAKNSGETLAYTFDFISKLTSGETIISAACTAAVWSGVDSSPASIVSGTATISGTKVTQNITGGVNGCIYMVNCRVTTSTSTVYMITTYIPVVSNPL